MGLFRQVRQGPDLAVRALFLSQIPLRNWEQDPAIGTEDHEGLQEEIRSIPHALPIASESR